MFGIDQGSMVMDPSDVTWRVRQPCACQREFCGFLQLVEDAKLSNSGDSVEFLYLYGGVNNGKPTRMSILLPAVCQYLSPAGV